MPKGQFSNIKGAVCNVPVKVDSMCNILPGGNGLDSDETEKETVV